MGWRPRGWLLGIVLLVVTASGAAVGQGSTAGVVTTQVADTIFRADGTAATGTVIISWPAFTTASGQTVPSGTTSAAIGTGGSISVQLAPNAGASPTGSYYTAVYHLDDGSVSREYWVVPVSPTAVTVSAIKSSVLPTSVAVQTASKSYVDAAIAAALTGRPLTSSTPYLVKTGDTMTGPLALPADPTSSAQAANKHYVDAAVAGVASGLTQRISTSPQATQTVAQPSGTQMQTNILNGVEYASQYVTGRGSNGVANALASPECANGCEVRAEQTYDTNESYLPRSMNSSLTSGTHVEDSRGGERRDTYFNPVGRISSGNDAGQVIDVTSTRSASSVNQQTGAEEPASLGLLITHQGLAGGSNQFPANIEPVSPYFKSTYSALSVEGSYNTLGQHVLVPRTIHCYGVGDCLAGSQYVYSSGGFRDEADEGTHPLDLQVQEDPKVFQGTCSTGCTTGSTQVMVAITSAPGTQGEGRFLIDKNPAKVISSGLLTGGANVAAGAPGPTASFSGTSFPVSVFLATAQLAQSQAHNVSPGTVDVAIKTSGVYSGFATNTAALTQASGVACVTDLPNGFNPTNYEMAAYTVTDATHLRMTLNKVHAAGATIAVGGLCGYGLEQTVDTAQGIRQVFPVIGSYAAGGLYYAGGLTPIVGVSGSTSAYLNVSLPVSAVSRNNNVVTITTAGNLPVDVSGLTMVISGVADASYNGSFVVKTTGPNSLTYTASGSNGTSSGGTLSLLTGGFALYPMAEVLGVFNTATKTVDGQMTLAANSVPWAANDPVEEPHYFQEAVQADMEFVGQTTPRPTVTAHAGLEYQINNGPGMRGWTIANAVPASSYLGSGGTHTVPDVAYEATGIWNRTFEGQAGDTSVFTIHCNSHGCGNWNSGYNLFELQSNGGTDVVSYQPTTSALTMNLRGTSYSFTNQGFTAGAVSAGSVSATTLSGAIDAGNIASGKVNAARLPTFGASGMAHAAGVVPDPGAVAGTSKFLREDGNWVTPPAGGGSSGAAAITSGTIDAATIGGTMPAAGSFTTLSAKALSVTSDATAPTTMSFLEPNQGSGAQFCQGFGRSISAHNSTFYCWWNTSTPYASLETYAGGDPIQLKGASMWLNGGPVAIGNSGTIGSALPALLNVGSSNQFQVDASGNMKAANFAGILSGTTGPIGGGALAAGSCASGAVAVAGATVGSPVAVSASDGSLPNGLSMLSAAVTSSGTVTVQVCAAGAVTPAAKAYNVRVIQ